MSDQPIRNPAGWLLILTVLILVSVLIPASIHAQEKTTGPALPNSLLVKARQGDTPATIARRYLKDASQAWRIREYNHAAPFSAGKAVVVPTRPFRRGGLAPDGYQIVPVLAYAAIGDAGEQKFRLSLTAFKDQMQWMKTKGFATITPAQMFDFMVFAGQLPRLSVLITADTESQAFFDLAVPILTAHGFTATVFVATDQVGKPGAMTWDQLKQLRNSGFTIGCRGKYGRPLTRHKKGQSFKTNFKWIESELRQAKKEVETHLDGSCLFLAYPKGRTSNLVSAMVAKLGFSAAFTLSPGDNPFFVDRFSLHRTAIDSRTSARQFGKMLTPLIAADLN